MNIRKTLRMSMIALLVVVGMTGMAAAENMYITAPSPAEMLPGGGAISYTVTLNAFDDMANPHNITSTIIDPTGSNDLQFEFVWSGTSSGWLESGDSYNWGPPLGSSDSIMMNVKAKTATLTDQTYRFKVEDSDGGWGESSATTKADTIPEFATLAIPVVALLGLVLYMRRKKD